LTEGLGHTHFMARSLSTGLRAQLVGTRSTIALFAHSGKDYLCDGDLEHATVTAELTTEAWVAVGGLEVSGRVLWPSGWRMGSAQSNFGNQWKPRVPGKPRCAGRQRQRAEAQSRCEVALNCRRVAAFCRGRSHAQCLERTITDAQPSVASTWYLCAPTFEVSRRHRLAGGCRLDRRVGAHVLNCWIIAPRGKWTNASRA